MPIAETLLAAATEAAFTYVIRHSGLQDRLLRHIGREPTQQAFQRALDRAVHQFEQQHPGWTASLFDGSFLEHEGAPVLAQFLLRNGEPDPTDLNRSADEIYMVCHVGYVGFTRASA